MIGRTRLRLAFFGSIVVALTAAACGTIAELDVKYDRVSAAIDGGPIDPSNIDGGSGGGGGGGERIIRDGSFVEPDVEAPFLDPSDGGPCEPDSDDGGGCDFSQGLGCCLLSGAKSQCIFSWEIADKCPSGVFVGCRADDVNSESACCWRPGPAGSTMSVLAVSCDGGKHACTPGGPTCARGEVCNPRACPVESGDFTIGTCGTPEVTCP